MKVKKTHGGKRAGAGRKAQEEKVRMYIPLSKVAAVKKIIEEKQ